MSLRPGPGPVSFEEFLSRLDGVRRTGDGRAMARCPSHVDRTASLSVRDAGPKILVHDFGGCPVEKVVSSLGLTMVDLSEWRGRPPTESASRRTRTLAQEAWRAVVAEARRQRARLEPYRPLFQVADGIRRRHQLAAEARVLASRLGDTDRAWQILALAAWTQTAARALEAGLDELAHVR